MASHLGIPLQEVQDKTTSSEFVDWIFYLDWLDTDGFRKDDFYMAQIASEIRRSFVAKPEKVKLHDFLLKFKEPDAPVQLSPEQRMKRSKSAWLGLFKMKEK